MFYLIIYNSESFEQCNFIIYCLNDVMERDFCFDVIFLIEGIPWH